MLILFIEGFASVSEGDVLAAIDVLELIQEVQITRVAKDLKMRVICYSALLGVVKAIWYGNNSFLLAFMIPHRVSGDHSFIDECCADTLPKRLGSSVFFKHSGCSRSRILCLREKGPRR